MWGEFVLLLLYVIMLYYKVVENVYIYIYYLMSRYIICRLLFILISLTD